ncbi:DUF4189 domain-containing protein [Xanthomonas arboricola]|uniref:DUF4189 domain-containing protein n=1 Tax=Xanthomonas arboricola TaxID=56448 RepID=UPI0009B90138|nr:DUF4189 domain-containing protein [Xanthomonas arboricola]
MRIYKFFIIILAFSVSSAHGEGGCPAGQYPVGGQGAVACAPIPQNSSQSRPRPSGKWIKTWGAIAMGSVNSVINYGVSTGKFSKNDAQREAMQKCASHGEQDCKITLTYQNQCAAISTPEIGGKPSGGTVHFSGGETIAKASTAASAQCKKSNPTPAQCSVIYSDCTEQVFEEY